MRTTVLLVKYEGGWREVRHPLAATVGRREAMVSFAGVTTTAEVDRLGRRLLDVLSQTRATVAIGTVSRGGDRAYLDYLTADTVEVGGTPYRVQSLTVAEDEDGQLQVTPELQDPLTIEEEAVNRVLRRMAEGNAEGLSEHVGPIVFPPIPIDRTRVIEMTTFSLAGSLVAGEESNDASPPFPMALTAVVARLKRPGPQVASATLCINGTPMEVVSIPAGQRRVVTPVSPVRYVAPADDVSFVITDDGNGHHSNLVDGSWQQVEEYDSPAQGLTLQVRAAPVSGR